IAGLGEQFGKALQLAGQVACVDGDGDLGFQQFGVQQGPFGQFGKQAGGQVVDAVEAVVLKNIEGGALARPGAAADDDQAHGEALVSALHVHYHLVEAGAVGSLAQAFAHIAAVQHAGDLAEQFKVLIGGGFRDQQDEQQVNRGAVDGVEIDWSIKAQHGADGRRTASEAAVGNGDAVAETGGTEFLPGYQAFEDVLVVEVGKVASDQLGDLFQYAFLAAARHVHEGTAGGQDLLESDHGGGVSGQWHPAGG